MKWIKLLRLHHWIKNILVLFPIVFAKELFNADLLFVAGVGFLSFCFASSGIYIVNDIKDLEDDKKHPVKCKRPIASGEIGKTAAIITAAICFCACFTLTGVFAFEKLYALLLMVAYIALNVLYSWKLKKIPIIDVFILSAGFVLRVLFGGAMCNIAVSAWLFLTVFALSIYLAFGKRLGELKKYGDECRQSLTGYTESFLSISMNSFFVCGLIFYALWTIGQSESTLLGFSQSSTLLILCIPVAIFALIRYSYDISITDSDGDPVGVVIHDKVMIMLVLLWCAMTLFALY